MAGTLGSCLVGRLSEPWGLPSGGAWEKHELRLLAWETVRLGPFREKQIRGDDAELILMDSSRWQVRRDEVSRLGIFIYFSCEPWHMEVPRPGTEPVPTVAAALDP